MLYRSYMSTHVILNLLNKLFCDKLNKSIIVPQILDSDDIIVNRTLKLL